jgi:HEAT repeat protein
MNKYNLIGSLLFLMTLIPLNGQVATKDNRTTETKIADLLAQLPATDQTYLATLMQSMTELGEEGLVKTASMLVPAGKGNDAAVRFAIGGFSKFVTQAGKETSRSLCEKAWCRAIDASTEAEVRAFLLAQLQMAGTDQSVSVIAKYLTDEKLSDPASRALAAIHSPAAGNALLNALPGTSGTAQLSLAEALGNMEFAPAADKLIPLCASADVKVRKTALYALAKTGSPAAGTVLLDAAKKSGFTYEPSDATASYLLWINRQVTGNAALAVKHSKNLIKLCIEGNQVHTRSAALATLVAAAGEKAGSFLLQAVQSPDKKYRVAALALAPQLKGSTWTASWTKAASKLSGEPRAEIIAMLGTRGDITALPLVKQGLSDGDQGTRLAAIKSFAAMAPDQALPDFMDLLKKGTPEDVSAIGAELLSMKGDALLTTVSSSLPDMPAAAKPALLAVLAARRNPAVLPQVYRETLSNEAPVRLAAFKALEGLVASGDLDALSNLLTVARSGEETKAVQAALISAVNTLPAKERTSTVVDKMAAAGVDGRSLYYPVLAGIGDKDALAAMFKEFNSVAPENASLKAGAIRSIVEQIKRSGYSDDQRLLLLRKTMELAGSTSEKSMIMKEIATCHTYPAFNYVLKYLNDPMLQQDAATAVSTIALASPELSGYDIREALTLVIGMLKGNEADYRKEAIRKHLAAMPADVGFVPLFNGKDLTGWKGLVENPIVRSKMTPKELAKAQAKADETMRTGWKVENGELIFTGKGENLCTTKQYGDIEMFVDWKIQAEGDAGIYLRGSPQVQIWDTSRRDAGAQVGSGALYNNQVNERIPLKVADNPIGEWNTFRILMQGERVTVYLNGDLVVNNVIMENYWDRSIPIFPAPLSLTAMFLYVRFQGPNLTGFQNRKRQRDLPNCLTVCRCSTLPEIRPTMWWKMAPSPYSRNMEVMEIFTPRPNMVILCFGLNSNLPPAQTTASGYEPRWKVMQRMWGWKSRFSTIPPTSTVTCSLISTMARFMG